MRKSSIPKISALQRDSRDSEKKTIHAPIGSSRLQEWIPVSPALSWHHTFWDFSRHFESFQNQLLFREYILLKEKDQWVHFKHCFLLWFRVIFGPNLEIWNMKISSQLFFEDEFSQSAKKINDRLAMEIRSFLESFPVRATEGERIRFVT